MKALTIRQPWADAIAHSTKRIENRTWKLPAKQHGARILIHAAAQPDKTAALPADANIGKVFGIVPIAQRGAIIAVATVTGCHFDTGCCRPWGMADTYHWQLANVVALPTPLPCKGALSFWTPPADLLTAAVAQLEERAA